MPDGTHPVRYLLYSHYAFGERADLRAYESGVPIAELSGVRHLFAHARGLRELLTAPGHEGLLVLFYSPGYKRFLDALAKGEGDGKLMSQGSNDRGVAELRFARAVADHVRSELRASGLEGRVRFLTSFDLHVIFGRVNDILKQQFADYFVGPAEGIRYDVMKVVEAILRLRVLGNGVPVLRLDDDVIFRGTNKDAGDLAMFKAVACAVRAYQLRQADPTVSTFLFSASYNSRALLHPSDRDDAFEAWSRAFATRVYPALVADPDEVKRICAFPEGSDADRQAKAKAWDRYVTTHLDDDLASRFYGVRQHDGRLEVEGTSGLTSIGAHPMYAVISGALLCLSEGAILDLPPFSNLRMNVMWIDDHLKYSLHRAMRHFTSGETLDLEPGLSEARMDDVTVTKARPPVDNLPGYVFDVYLPTLLWGAIFDAWITDDPILKVRLDSLVSPADKERWRAARLRQEGACLPQAMLEALQIGHLEPGREQLLRDELERIAVLRIEAVRQLWAQLKDPHHGTFASYWAEGTVQREFGACFAGKPNGLWQGIAPGRPLGSPIQALEDLSPALLRDVLELINDTVAYVRWTLAWPNFVQVVRSITQGTFPGDITWQPNAN